MWTDELGVEFSYREIPEQLAEQAHEARTHLIEACADYDDELMEAYLNDEEIPHERIATSLHRATLDIKVTPVLCGSSFKNKGVQPLLDAIVELLPSPLEVPPVQGHRAAPEGRGRRRAARPSAPPTRSAPFAALAFKVMADPYVGKLTYFRVYSGKLSAGSRVLNASNGRTERIGRLLMMHANHREEIEECFAGDICAGVGLKQTGTGDTLCAPDAPIVLETIEFPEPVIAVAIEPKTKADQEKLAASLARLAEEDPTFQVQSDEETGQTLIHGMGELHLEVIVDRLLREFSVDANVGRPQVAYRETIRRPAEKVEGRFVRQTGGRGQYGHVVINLEPAPGEGFDFVNKIKGGAIPSEFIPAVEQGIEEALASGIRAGYPMVDVRVELTDGSYHDVDSSEMAFKIAGSMAVQEAARRAEPGAARAGDGGRGRDPRGLPRRRDRRPLTPARQGAGPGAARQRGRHPGVRPPRRDVRIRHRPALLDPGPRHLHDAVRALRGGSGEHRRADRRAPQPRTRGGSVVFLYFRGSPG